MRGHMQRVGNLFMIALLRSPLHCLASGSLVLITYRGRSSGRRFTLPVLYAEHDATLTIFVGHPEQKQWWRNLRGGADVDVWLRGRRERRRADVLNCKTAAEIYLDRYPQARMTIEAADSPIFVRVAALTPKSG